MAPMTFFFSLAAFSMKSARRARIRSSTPPASPALIMFTYSLSNALGYLLIASDSVPPPSTSSATPPMIALRSPGFCCCSRICSDRRMGRPASWRVESWRGRGRGGRGVGGKGDGLLARPAADRDRHLPLRRRALGRAALLLLHPLLGGLLADLG